MKNIFRKLTLYSVALAAVSFSSCSLEENNPAGFTKENLATSIEGYETLVNQCYFAMERYFYGTDSWMSLTEGDSDLWTYQANQSTSYTQWFWFFAGASPNTTYTNNWWNGTYDGVGSCNEAIALAGYAPYKTEAERNAKVAEARFLRAIYYFNAVEQFGGVTMLTEPETTLNYAPERTDPLTIYKEVIIPDLEYAVEWLAVGTHATTTVPTKKAAPGLGKPVLVMRDTTERPEALEAGTVKLVGTDYDKIVYEVSALLDDQDYYEQMSKAINPYGDGIACDRILSYIELLWKRNIERK